MYGLHIHQLKFPLVEYIFTLRKDIPPESYASTKNTSVLVLI